MKTITLSTATRLALLLLMPFVLVSCVGPRGPEGIPGRDGRDGNANVISINYEAISSDWYDVGTPGTDDYFLALDLDVPEINTDIVESGLVMVYYRPDTQSPWIALPYTYISHNPSFVEKLDFIYDLNFLGIQSMATDKSAAAYEGFFRVIVASAIPVGKVAVDLTNYEEVAEFYEITEDMQVYR
ncbi:MAG: hypothetical protein AAFP02_05490 [Bacteroidota bacterium]